MKRCILITGGAGYVGSATIQNLLDRHYCCVAIDKKVDNYWKSVLPGVTVLRGDICNTGLLDRAFSRYRPIGVIHLAGIASATEGRNTKTDLWRANLITTQNVVKTMEKYKSRFLVFSSSAAVYGSNKHQIQEDAPLCPISTYGETKVACERFIEGYATTRGIRYAILRYFNVAGYNPTTKQGWSRSGENGLFSELFGLRYSKRPLTVNGHTFATKDKTAQRDYVHVLDVAEVNERALLQLISGPGPFIVNVGSGKRHTVLEVIREFEKEIGAPVPFIYGYPRSGDIETSWASINKAKRLLRWRPKRSMLSFIVRGYLHKYE